MSKLVVLFHRLLSQEAPKLTCNILTQAFGNPLLTAVVYPKQNDKSWEGHQGRDTIDFCSHAKQEFFVDTKVGKWSHRTLLLLTQASKIYS